MTVKRATIIHVVLILRLEDREIVSNNYLLNANTKHEISKQTKNMYYLANYVFNKLWI